MILNKINNAGTIFIGNNTPIAIGDYIAGPSHTLPTNTSSRFSSGLSVLDFLKKTSFVWVPNKHVLRSLSRSCIFSSLAEGFDLHALSVSCRL